MEKTILEDSDRTIHQDYTNVNENNKLALEQSMEELESKFNTLSEQSEAL